MNQLGCTQCCIHFTYATPGQYQLVTTQDTLHILPMSITRHPFLLQTFCQLSVFAIHCADDSYLHIYMY